MTTPMTKLGTTARPRANTEADSSHPDGPSLSVDRFSDRGAEMGVLSSMAQSPECVPYVCRILHGDADFYFDGHAEIFRVFVDLHEGKKNYDAITVVAELRKRGIIDRMESGYIDRIFNAAPGPSNAENYAEVVADRARVRRLLGNCYATIKDIGEAVDDAGAIEDRACSRLMEAASKRPQGGAAIMTAAECIQQEMERLYAGVDDGAITTSWAGVNELIPGFRPGEYAIVAARPSVGKTAFIQGIMDHACRFSNRACGFISIEMSSQQLFQRMLASEAGIDLWKFRKGQFSTAENESLKNAAALLCNWPLYLRYPVAPSIMDLRMIARELHEQYPLELLCIDYAQLISAKGSNENERLTQVSLGLKMLARELNIPVIVCCQLNRSNETEKRRPKCSDMRGSGTFEQDADIVILLHRETVTHRGDPDWHNPDREGRDIADVIVAKNRNGPCDTTTLEFLGDSVRFVDDGKGT